MPHSTSKFHQWFSHAAARVAGWVGSPYAFLGATSLIVLWLVTGPIFGYSDTWQLLINTSTTIITFLMVFLIQNTQNRDARAMQLTVDEVIRAVEKARNQMIDIESLSDGELNQLHETFTGLRSSSDEAGETAKKLQKAVETRNSPENSPENSPASEAEVTRSA